MKRRHVAIASFWTLCLGGAAALIACGGGDDSSSPPVTDSGADSTTATGNPNPSPTSTTGDTDATTNDASISDAAVDAPLVLEAGALTMTIYAGQSATLNAGGMAGGSAISYVWTLTSAPAGSVLTSASIRNATSESATLPTDKAGTYLLNVVATSGAKVDQATVTVVAVAAHVVYAEETSNDGGLSLLSTVDTDGTNRHAIICPFVGTHEIGYLNYTTYGQVGAAGAVDTFEGPPGSVTKVAFGSVQDGGTSYLYITDTSGVCPTGGDAGANAQVIAQIVGDAAAPYVNVMHPRFSPDGTKILFNASYQAFYPPNTGATVDVVNADGSNHVVLTTMADVDAATSGELSQLGNVRQVEWKDATHVGWTREELDAGAGGFWEVVVASVPSVSGDPQAYMTCAGASAPNRVVFLAGGAVLTTHQPANAPLDLVVLQPDATTKQCTLVHNLSALSDAGANTANVQSFALSPDGKTAAYSANDPSLNDGGPARYVVYTVPVDGSLPATRVGSIDSVDLATGVRWIAGGGQLAFTHAGSPDGGGTRAVASIPAFVSTQPTDLAIPDAGTTLSAVGSGDGTGCSFGGKSAPTLGFFGGALALLGLARSRSRRSRRNRAR